MASEIRVNQIQSRTGVSTISFTETGPIISGVTTITGDLDVTGLVSFEDVTNIDSVGVVTATAFHGDGSALTGITGTTINNNADNRLITGSGTANTLEGEANLTFNGSKLVLAANSTAYDAFQVGDGLFIGNTTDNVSAAIFHQGGGADLEIGSQDMITFTTGNTAGNATERLRITSSGDVGIGDNAPNSSYGTNLSVHSTTTDGARIKISDGTSGKGNVDGLDIIHQSGIAYFIQRESNDMRFFTANTERVRISNIGQVTTKGNNQGNPVGIEIRNNNTNGYSHAELSLTSQNATTSKIWCDVPNSGMRLNYNGGTSVKIDQSGNLVMGNGAGIDFSATSDTQYVMSSELFDDYEEGTWTPTMGFATAYGTQSGKYVKVGKTVHIWFEIQVTAWSTYTGSTRITSSPFPIDKVTGCWAAVINATATTRDWRVGPWTGGGYGMGVWMENGQGSATSAGIRMSENTFSDYSSLTGSLGTNFTMKGGMTYISTT